MTRLLVNLEIYSRKMSQKSIYEPSFKIEYGEPKRRKAARLHLNKTHVTDKAGCSMQVRKVSRYHLDYLAKIHVYFAACVR
jgi:hypothetical protein